jgi:hypothetical protein
MFGIQGQCVEIGMHTIRLDSIIAMEQDETQSQEPRITLRLSNGEPLTFTGPEVPDFVAAVRYLASLPGPTISLKEVRSSRTPS